MMAAHRVRAILDAAADGTFPEVDGRVEVVPPDAGGTQAIIAFTGHSYVLSHSVTSSTLAALGADGYGGSLRPDVQRAIAGDDHRIGSLDVVLVTRGRGRGLADGFTVRDDLAEHPRVARANRYRSNVVVAANQHGVLVHGDGLLGRREVSVELFVPASSGRGAGRALIDAARDLVPDGEPLWAQVAPGNAASLRAFLACGFVPVCSEILITEAELLV